MALPGMSRNEQLQTVFSLYDATGLQLLPVSSLGVALRAAGHNPTDAQIEDVLTQIPVKSNPKDHSQSIDFAGFTQALKLTEHTASLATKYGNHDTLQKNEQAKKEVNEQVAKYVQAFKLFDPESTGRMQVQEFRNVMSSIGEKMEDTEVDELLRRIGHDLVHEGKLDYETFIRRLVLS